MSFLLDTNVVSEWTKPIPNPGVISWLAGVAEDRVFLSVVTLTELRYGVERLSPGQGRKRLNDWLQGELMMRFEGRILSIDRAIADVCGTLCGSQRSNGTSDQSDGCIRCGHGRGSSADTCNPQRFALPTHPECYSESLDVIGVPLLLRHLKCERIPLVNLIAGGG